MIIDFHTHIFPKDIRNTRERYFEGESAFRLLYDSPGSTLVSAEQTIAAMDEQGVDKAVVFGFPWRTADTFKLQNDYVMAVVEKYPDRLIGMACFDPASPEAVRERRFSVSTVLAVAETRMMEMIASEATAIRNARISSPRSARAGWKPRARKVRPAAKTMATKLVMKRSDAPVTMASWEVPMP